MADRCFGLRERIRTQPRGRHVPRLAAVVTSERARRGYGHIHPLRIVRVDQDGVETHAACPGGPVLPCRVRPQPVELGPGLTPISGPEERGILYAGKNGMPRNDS